MKFRSKLDVLGYVRRHRGHLSEAALERLARLHDTLPDEAAAVAMAARRGELESELIAGWKAVCDVTDNPSERERRMAQAVAMRLGGDDVWRARRIALLYADHGMRPVNRCLLGVASRPGFERLPVDDRFRALEGALARTVGCEKRGRSAS